MFKTCTIVIAVLLLLGSAAGQDKDKKAEAETITGTVVAYDHFSTLFPCYHICRGFLIVRLEKADRATNYVRVDFTYPDGKFPNELIKNKKIFRFRVTRTTEDDAPLIEFVKQVNEKTGEQMPSTLRAFRLLPGAEGEQLPFGQTLPSYSLAEDVFDLLKRK